MFCQECGTQIPDNAAICIKCGVHTGRNVGHYRNVHAHIHQPPKSRVAYILLGFFLGTIGVHNFYAGYSGKGIAQLLITLFMGWLIIPYLAVCIWVIVEIIAVDKDAYGIKMT